MVVSSQIADLLPTAIISDESDGCFAPARSVARVCSASETNSQM